MEIILDVLLESLLDCLKMLPILYLAYLLMEFLEHHAGGKMQEAVAKVGRAGPVIGSLLGVIPQCGFSGAVAGLYAGGIATVGTLLAVFISTSDEMLPILLSNGTDVLLIGKLILSKFIFGLVFGFIIDLLVRRKQSGEIHELCEREHCACERHNIFVSALIHCAQVIAVIFAVTFVLGLIIELGGGDAIANILPDIPVVGELTTAVIGLIPSCSVSVLLTGLYINGAITPSMLMAGRCANGGVGLLVLYRLNKNVKDNLLVTGLLLLCGVLAGLLYGLIG